MTLLSFAVKAGKVSFGHDACKQSLRRQTACMLLAAADASPRLTEEMRGLGENLPFAATDLTIVDIGRRLGRRAAVLTVNDRGFADSLMENLNAAENKED